VPNSPAVPLPNPEIPLPADSLNLSQVADFKKIFFLDREVFADEVGFFPVGREISHVGRHRHPQSGSGCPAPYLPSIGAPLTFSITSAA